MRARLHALSVPFLAFALALTGAQAPARASANMALAPGDKAPDLRGFLVDGSPLRSDYAKQKFTLINFWATWCEPCKAEMPALQQLYEAHADSGLAVIGVMNDNVSLDMMQSFAESLGVSYPVVQPRKDMGRRWRGTGVLPATFLIDDRGIVVRRYVGATAEQIQGLVDDVEAVLAGRPLGSQVIPETPATATEADRQRALRKQR